MGTLVWYSTQEYMRSGWEQVALARQELTPIEIERNRYLAEIEDRIAKGEAGQVRVLPSTELDLQIGKNCNLRCIGCYMVGNFKPIYMAVADIREILEHTPANLAFIGFESGFADPMIHPDFFEILKACKEFRPQAIIKVQTNGAMALSDDLLGAVCLIDRLTLSVDGATKQTYENIRRGADFDLFKRNLEAITLARRKAGRASGVTFRFTVTRTNLHELAGVVELAHEFGVRTVAASPMVALTEEIAERIKDIVIETMPHEDITRLRQTASDRASALNVTLELWNGDGNDDAKRQDDVPEPPADEPGVEYCPKICQYPWGGSYQIIKQHGRSHFVPCQFLEEDAVAVLAARYGFAYDKLPSVEEIYNSPGMWQFRKDLARGATEDLCSKNCYGASISWPLRLKEV
jgi:MoaA/NifB/PqqE/SkfB family radical SAM enzyme